MTLDEKLSSFGLTRDQAWTWVTANLSTPQTIVDECSSAGVTSEDLAELASDYMGPLTRYDVEAYFNSQSVDPSKIAPPVTAIEETPAAPSANEALVDLDDFCTPALAAFTEAVIHFNTADGTLSTEALRARVLEEVNSADYWGYFDIMNYPEEYVDEEFTYEISDDDCGLAELNIEPTRENVESLYYGIITNITRNLDVTEISALQNQQEELSNTMDASNYSEVLASILDNFYSSMANYLQSPATNQIYSDTEIADALVENTVALVGLYSAGDFNSLDGIWYDSAPLDSLLSGGA